MGPSRRLGAGLTLLLATAMGGCASTPGNGAPGDEMLAVVRTQMDAWNEGDIERFCAAGLWPSDELTFLSGGSWTRGYDATLARYRRRYTEGDAEMGALVFSDLEALPLGDGHGMVRGRWALTFSDGSGSGGLFTLVMRRFAQGWRVVHDHTSLDR